MKVKLAFQILSRRTAAAVRTAGQTGALKSNTWAISASFIEELDRVIDACNSYYLNTLNKQKRTLSDRNPEIEKRLTDFVNKFQNWTARYEILIKKSGIKKLVTSTPPCFHGIPITINALLAVYNDLKKEFPGFELAAGLCNQDCVEHSNAKVRGRGGFNDKSHC